VLLAKEVVCGTAPLPGESAVFPVRGPVTGEAAQSSERKIASSNWSFGVAELLKVVTPIG
jgi:hypothetical protein